MPTNVKANVKHICLPGPHNAKIYKKRYLQNLKYNIYIYEMK